MFIRTLDQLVDFILQCTFYTVQCILLIYCNHHVPDTLLYTWAENPVTMKVNLFTYCSLLYSTTFYLLTICRRCTCATPCPGWEFWTVREPSLRGSKQEQREVHSGYLWVYIIGEGLSSSLAATMLCMHHTSLLASYFTSYIRIL